MSHQGENFDAVVIGAGPAGALAARGLGLLRRSVLLVDKQAFPRPKVCGCCLNRYALTTLDTAGLPDLVNHLDARPLQKLRMIAAGRSAHVPLPRGVSLSRQAFDGALVQAAVEAGAEFRSGVSAKVRSLGAHVEEGHTLSLGDGREVRTRCVVVADGLGGSSLSLLDEFAVETRPASRVGLGGVTAASHTDRIAPGTIEMACGQDGYLGVVELEDGRLDFAAAIDAAAVKDAGGLPAAARRLADQAGVDPEAWPLDQVERWRATPALTRSRSRLAGPGLFVVGDAAGYVEPFTGEGMAWAVNGGVAVAEVASAAVEQWSPGHERLWENRFRKHVRRRQSGCRLVAGTLRRPRLTRAVVRSLAAWPGLAQPLIRRITAPGSTPGNAPGKISSHTAATPQSPSSADLREIPV